MTVSKKKYPRDVMFPDEIKWEQLKKELKKENKFLKQSMKHAEKSPLHIDCKVCDYCFWEGNMNATWAILKKMKELEKEGEK